MGNGNLAGRSTMTQGKRCSCLRARVELAQNYGLNDRQIRAAEALIRKHENDIRTTWRKHFGR
jgi:hypothetical protein